VTEIEAEVGGSRIRELDRIAAFTDGVFAIAITLLVLAIDVPNVNLEPGTTLADKLLDLWPDLFAYALSFAVIGRYWVLHHRFFASLRHYDGRLVFLNLFFLAWIVLIPFVSDLLGDFGDETAAVIAYAVVLTAVGLVNWLIVRHSLRAGLVDDARRDTLQDDLVGLLLPGVFLLSIPVALVSPRLAALMWLLLFAVHPAAWLTRRRAGR
jgi:uncharacterized membrane protein